MNPRLQLAEDLFDSSVRIDKIIWLASQQADSPSEDFTEFLEYQDDDAERLLGKLPPQDISEFEEYIADLSNRQRLGYLVNAESPIRSESGLFSWGYYRSEWFYFETWDEAEVSKALVAWSEELQANPDKEYKLTLRGEGETF